MSKEETAVLSCPACGHRVPVGTEICAQCNYNLSTASADNPSAKRVAWEREGDRLKKLWVIAVVFFWFSLSFQAALYFLDGSLNIVLLSVIGGMMILGIVLKTRYQLHLRNKPLEQETQF